MNRRRCCCFRFPGLKQTRSGTDLGLGAVVLLDDGPVLPVQAVAHPELLHEDVSVAVLPSLDHHAAQHLLLSQIHLQAETRAACLPPPAHLWVREPPSGNPPESTRS